MTRTKWANTFFLNVHYIRRRVWLPAIRGSVGEPMGFHDLRHTHAALLNANNDNPKVIKEHPGHRDNSMTLNVYGHLSPKLAKDAADRLNEGFVQICGHFSTTADDGVELR